MLASRAQVFSFMSPWENINWCRWLFFFFVLTVITGTCSSSGPSPNSTPPPLTSLTPSCCFVLPLFLLPYSQIVNKDAGLDRKTAWMSTSSLTCRPCRVSGNTWKLGSKTKKETIQGIRKWVRQNCSPKSFWCEIERWCPHHTRTWTPPPSIPKPQA